MLHWTKVSARKRFRNDCLDAILSERAHQRMRSRDFPKPVYGVGHFDCALANEVGQPPSLTAIFDQLCIRDSAPCLADFDFFVSDQDVATRERDFAQAICRDSNHRFISDDGCRGCTWSRPRGNSPVYSLYLCQAHPGL